MKEKLMEKRSIALREALAASGLRDFYVGYGKTDGGKNALFVYLEKPLRAGFVIPTRLGDGMEVRVRLVGKAYPASDVKTRRAERKRLRAINMGRVKVVDDL